MGVSHEKSLRHRIKLNVQHRKIQFSFQFRFFFFFGSSDVIGPASISASSIFSGYTASHGNPAGRGSCIPSAMISSSVNSSRSHLSHGSYTPPPFKRRRMARSSFLLSSWYFLRHRSQQKRLDDNTPSGKGPLQCKQRLSPIRQSLILRPPSVETPRTASWLRVPRLACRPPKTTDGSWRPGSAWPGCPRQA